MVLTLGPLLGASPEIDIRSELLRVASFVTTQMVLDDVLSRIPLILSYPTVLLSSNLIVGTGADASVGSDGLLEPFMKHLMAPLLCASAATAFGGAFSAVEQLSSCMLLAFVSFSLNSLLGHTQTSVLSALLLQALSGCITYNWAFTIFPALSLSLNYLEGHSYYKTALSYIAILLTLQLKTKTIMGSKIMINIHLRPAHYALICLSIAGFLNLALIDPLNLFSEASGSRLTVQNSMVFICFGCLALLLVSWKEICNEAHPSNALKVVGSPYVPPMLGLAAIMVQFLSSNRTNEPLPRYVIILLFIFFSGIISAKNTRQLSSDPHEDDTHTTCVEHHHHHHHNLPCDANHKRTEVSSHDDSHHSHGHNHGHDHAHSHSQDSHFDETPSQMAGMFFQLATNPETRPIFSFLLLNTTFMFVQLLYSFRSKSLGLLSDSLHMALDCMSLLLGLVAGALSKNPANDKFPFALGYLETLAGFTNGVLLIGIVSGILVEAIDRVMNPTAILETTELLVVSFLGLVVNLLGLFVFDHGSHGHDGENENMRGIFLHIMADTLGSVGVVISTVLTKLFKLQIFDPIASIFIATLILMSSIPLIQSTTASMLLRLNDKQYNKLKNALNDISMTPGITGYTTPRFWPLSSSGSHGGHTHAHSHSHSHSNAHSHSHEGATDDNNLPAATRASQKLVGYIHIQYMDGENSTIIKKRVEKILESAGIQAWIQVEHKDSSCWCRSYNSSGGPVIANQQ
ncbi:LADA_0C00584g1_1 [Lachancea dasiensis]|uniref:Zinc transporter n=1 Tax=Lachancea dasiensis TaxID=1072105 RepID=A0A1G4IX46_9SACH|nr:LADA_0C00584g1_1 [Lachancea dasiensis]